MKTFAVTVDNDIHATRLKEILKEVRFVKKIESTQNEDELTLAQIQLLEERLTIYKKNPKRGKSLEQFKKELKLRYGV